MKHSLRDKLVVGTYCKAGLAMFPFIVSMTCIEAAIAVFNQEPVPAKCVAPHIMLTRETLPEFYAQTEAGWQLIWESIDSHLRIPIKPERDKSRSQVRYPGQIGLIVPFTEQEWYRNLTLLLKSYAEQYEIGIQIIDAEQSVQAARG